MAHEGLIEAHTGLEELAPLVREIGWRHNLIILERFKDPLEREFYLRMTRKFDWSEKCRAGQDCTIQR
jgi:predicted nuclease of restriction endonuclease-like (RecB) superfamily